MKFAKGDAWTGNRNGRPKEIDFRHGMTREIVEKHKLSMDQVVGIALEEAMARKQWAIKLAIKELTQYFYSKPRPMDIMELELDHGEEFKQMSPTILMQIKQLLTGNAPTKEKAANE